MKSLTLVAAALIAVFASACTADATDASAPEQQSEDLTKARFTSLKHPTNKALAGLDTAGGKFKNAYIGTYRFNKAGPEAHDADAREKRIKEVMHRYMCGFFDESIDIGRNTGSVDKKVATVLSDVDMDNNAYDQDTDLAGFSDAMKKVYAESSLDVLSGSASGNNTMGEIMGVYDTTHNEVFFFGFTNCGSDD
jgi:hypothetical protein